MAYRAAIANDWLKKIPSCHFLTVEKYGSTSNSWTGRSGNSW